MESHGRERLTVIVFKSVNVQNQNPSNHDALQKLIQASLKLL
jgi:hypothetical protein